MVKLVGFIRKRQDLTTEAFAAHWLGVHAAIARAFPGLRRYRINLIDRARYPEAAYDGFSELWFDSRAALDAAFAGPVGARIAADIPNFIGELARVVVDEHEVALPPGRD
jgi:uncharacterized protein (TIGR02118 family)